MRATDHAGFAFARPHSRESSCRTRPIRNKWFQRGTMQGASLSTSCDCLRFHGKYSSGWFDCVGEQPTPPPFAPMPRGSSAGDVDDSSASVPHPARTCDGWGWKARLRLRAFVRASKSPGAIKQLTNSACEESVACGAPPCRAYRPQRSCGRVAEGGGLLNRYRVVKPYRGFESLRLRHFRTVRPGDIGNRSYLRHR
jgi:hypothetical protein